MKNLTTGTRIYYTGDMANDEGFGLVVKRTDDPKWGSHVDILMDDGRKMNVHVCTFSPEYLGHGGTRFVTEAAYNEWREARIAASPFMQKCGLGKGG